MMTKPWTAKINAVSKIYSCRKVYHGIHLKKYVTKIYQIIGTYNFFFTFKKSIDLII